MTPTSSTFLALLGLALVGVTGTTVIAWGRGRRLRRTRNLGLLALGQLLAATLLLSLVNVHENFYPTWSDVFGTGGPGGLVVVASGPGLTVAPARSPDSALGTGPAGRLDRALTVARAARHGTGSLVADVTVPGPRTGYRWRARVYLPALYFSPRARHRTFPVLELFGGSGSPPGAAFGSVPLQRSLDTAISAGTLPPIIAISPTRNPVRLPDTQCIDDAHGFREFTYLARDVPAVVPTLLRARRDRGGWATMGFSSGGYCAADLALRRPEQYATAVSLSGYFSGPIDAFPMVDPAPADRLRDTPLTTVRQVRQPMSFVLVSARDDTSAMTELRQFAAAVHTIPGDHEVTITTAAGGHTSLAWRGAMPAVLAALGADLWRHATPAASGLAAGLQPRCAQRDVRPARQACRRALPGRSGRRAPGPAPPRRRPAPGRPRP
ncbi:MAG TPA: alpha/beta hydrolase-fold protein [Mycobacteriales bacterium]|jgi:enterochelin esterase-like enzyme|nr:alpha/beta hydrolase-fold protein [Mycobacteriales bacterium]